MKIRDKTQNDPTMSVFDWIGEVARKVGAARFLPGRRLRNSKTHIDVHVEDFIVECCVQDDTPEAVAIAVAAELSRRRGKVRSCAEWKDHVWEERPDGLYACAKCTFVKSFGEIAYAEALGYGAPILKNLDVCVCGCHKTAHHPPSDDGDPVNVGCFRCKDCREFTAVAKASDE